ncbi:LysR substrate-binding domain-containing protein [Mesorhizobium sp. CO1-1-8]|uniref:LysR substrate-binding domain-containing protein n=1 Tax=Mesorhizobium sp. CO1-1-8 TaxID=2876631 RepID=UPI001CD167EF|nr:LysR substrate-binding domain-containing protein [Mesorhizobium sp. CO1-1-8]MBZ9772498.1 LysR family transcriptional regulator [Mesorhizobium sp. CO1-1-8]
MKVGERDSVPKEAEFTPREIEVFASVMLHGTTTKAADALDITQPAVSKMLQHLTEKADFQLFRKSRQRLIPTPEAHMLYAEVQRVFESARGISRAAREIRELRSGRLNICALPAFGSTILPSIITSFSKQHPSVSISLDIRSSATVVQRAGRNQLDIGIGVTASEENPSIVRRALTATPPVCVMPAGHPLSQLEVIQADDLDGLDFISMGSADPMRRQLDALCDKRGISRQLKVEASLSGACIALAASGAGVTVVDRLSAWMARDLPIEIRDFRPHLDLNLSVYRPWGVIASTAADAFTEHLIQTTRSFMNGVDAGISALGTR